VHNVGGRAVLLARTTQTNEPARCALLLSILGTYGRQPLALLEVGASAGLCLLPDRYGYEPLMATAPANATLVVFHTAVLAYVASQAARNRFADTMRGAGVDGMSIEAPGVFPEIARKAPRPPARRGQFLLARNGQPLAWAGPHGQSIDWFDA
jgi:hypothetical protein